MALTSSPSRDSEKVIDMALATELFDSVRRGPYEFNKWSSWHWQLWPPLHCLRVRGLFTLLMQWTPIGIFLREQEFLANAMVRRDSSERLPGRANAAVMMPSAILARTECVRRDLINEASGRGR